jgi:hypothetical protein
LHNYDKRLSDFRETNHFIKSATTAASSAKSMARLITLLIPVLSVILRILIKVTTPPQKSGKTK